MNNSSLIDTVSNRFPDAVTASHTLSFLKTDPHVDSAG